MFLGFLIDSSLDVSDFWWVLVRYFVESPLTEISLRVSSWLDWADGLLRGKPQRKNAIFTTLHQGYLPSTWVTTVGVALITWLRECLSAFSTAITFFFPFSYCASQKKVPKHSPHIRAGVLGSTLSGGQSIYLHYLEFFCTEELCILPHSFIYSTIYLHQDGPRNFYFIL